MDIAAKDLKFGDTLAYKDDMYHVIEATRYGSDHTKVWMSPTDGLGLDEKIGFPNEFCFHVTNRL